MIKGAELAAAGRTLGMSEEETLAAVSREYRRQRRADDNVSPQDVLRRMAQSAATTTTDVGGGELKGVGYAGVSDEAFAFGEDVAYNEQYGSTRADDEQTYRANDRGFTEDEETGLVRRENFEETRGNMPDIAPKSALRDALARLEEGTQQFGYSAFPGSADVAARLEDDITPNRQAEASLARELNNRDESTFSGRRRAYNNIRAEIEADQISRDMYVGGGQGQFADENIGRIAEIRSLGKVGETAHVVRTANDAITGQVTRRQDGVYLDPTTGDPVAIQGPELPSVLAGDRTPNNGSSSDAVNAPQTAQEWITGTMPDYIASDRTFGDYPQVDITLETTNFANKVREYGKRNNLAALQGVSGNIRSVDELQKLVSYIASKNPGGLTVPDPERPGRSMPAGNNVTGGVMNALGMSLGEQSRFSNAMFQLDAARRSSVNQNPTGTYLSRTGEPTEGVIFDAKEAVSRRDGEAQVARIPKGATIGVTVPGSDKPQRRSIVTELSRLQGDGAQKPFMGQVEGEKPRVNRRKPGGMGSGNALEENIAAQARKRSRGKPVDQERVRQNQVKARLAEERENRDNRTRAERASTLIASLPPNARRVRIPGRG